MSYDYYNGRSFILNHFNYKGVEVTADDLSYSLGEEQLREEIDAYIASKQLLLGNISRIELMVDKEMYLCIKPTFKHHSVERIRRITGYLVGTLDSFNNAKRGEQDMRVKHHFKKDK